MERWILIDRFREEQKKLGNTQPRICWVICCSVPVCVAMDRVRPCSPAELLAFHYTQTKSSSPLAADVQTNVRADTNDERREAKSGRNCKRVTGIVA